MVAEEEQVHLTAVKTNPDGTRPLLINTKIRPPPLSPPAQTSVKVTLKAGPNGYGFKWVKAGPDRERFKGDTNYFITKVDANSPAGNAQKAGKLCPQDTIYSVNGTIVKDMKPLAFHGLLTRHGQIDLVLYRYYDTLDKKEEFV